MRNLLLVSALTLPLMLVGCQSDSDLGASESLDSYDTLISGLAAEDSEVRAESAEGIARFDLDGDGMLSSEEFETARATLQAEFLTLHDRDGDGALSEEEREEAHEEVRAEFLARYDTDGDGEISPEEREVIRENHPGYGGRFGRHGAGPEERKEAFLERFDSDGDGVLSEEEREAIEERRPPPHHDEFRGRPGWW